MEDRERIEIIPGDLKRIEEKKKQINDNIAVFNNEIRNLYDANKHLQALIAEDNTYSNEALQADINANMVAVSRLQEAIEAEQKSWEQMAHMAQVLQDDLVRLRERVYGGSG